VHTSPTGHSSETHEFRPRPTHPIPLKFTLILLMQPTPLSTKLSLQV
jgi:hypothetical protein